MIKVQLPYVHAVTMTVYGKAQYILTTSITNSE